MRRGLAAALVVFAGILAADAGQAPQKLRATEASQGQTPKAGSEAGGPPASTQSAPASTSHGLHFITVTFDYDFSKTPACSATVTTACVEKFVAYDISAGVKNRTKLFEIPLPPKPIGLVKGITAKSPKELDFESGKHLIAVVAREPDGHESRHRACTTWIEIP